MKKKKLFSFFRVAKIFLSHFFNLWIGVWLRVALGIQAVAYPFGNDSDAMNKDGGKPLCGEYHRTPNQF
jgi:hypothetical protein